MWVARTILLLDGDVGGRPLAEQRRVRHWISAAETEQQWQAARGGPLGTCGVRGRGRRTTPEAGGEAPLELEGGKPPRGRRTSRARNEGQRGRPAAPFLCVACRCGDGTQGRDLD